MFIKQNIIMYLFKKSFTRRKETKRKLPLMISMAAKKYEYTINEATYPSTTEIVRKF